VAVLLGDLRSRFSQPSGEVIARPQGRVAHLVYRPHGALQAVFVRFGARGGAVRILGGFYLSWRRVPTELEVMGEARRRGAPVPEPIAGAAWRSGPFWRTAIVTSAVADAVPACEHPDRRAAMHAAGRAVRALLDAGVDHPDLHWANILVERSNPGHAWIVDLDRARIGSGPVEPERVLRRLHRSLRRLRRRGIALSATDRLRFARGGGIDPRVCPR
jgi:3-deoxy-D-manno-octulosonic acid kinase